VAAHRCSASQGAVLETRQIESKRATFRHNDCPLNHILQLTHVAGPIVALQFLHVQLGQARTSNYKAAGGLFDKVFGNLPDIFETLSQRRDLDWEDAETIIQVEAEPACFGLCQEVAIRCRYETDFYCSGALVSHPLKLPFLQDAQKLALEVQRDFPDLVQKQGAVVCQIEAADTIFNGARERASDMAK